MAAHDALRTILPVAGLQPERAASVEIRKRKGDPEFNLEADAAT